MDLNSVKLKYYPFMINQDICNESCNVVYDLSTKICFPNKSKSVNFKITNKVTRIIELKALAKHISIFHASVHANMILQHVI